MIKRLITSLICFTFIFSNLQYVHAQDFSINQLPVPGTMVGASAPFAPLALKGLVVDPQKPLEFQFIVDTGRASQEANSVKDQANQLVKYFLAGLTIPEGELWVNLSPYEKDRMVPEALGQTDLGRDLLAQDYVLKQLTASLIYPEKDLGKEFWSKVYAKAQEQFGTTNIPVNTFNKVWILPNQAQVFQNGNAAYVTKSSLKVMLDEDYLAKQKNRLTKASSVSSQVVREIILPEIEKEVNTGKNFAPLRQIYQALILAKWYKETIQNGLLDAVYTNKNKTAGVNMNDPAVKEQIYDRYLQAYKKGVFNYIKEDSAADGQTMPRKYFSGGITKLEPDHVDTDGAMSAVTSDGAMEALTVDLEKPGDLAMNARDMNFAFIAYTDQGPKAINLTEKDGAIEEVKGTLDLKTPLQAAEPKYQQLADLVNGALNTLNGLLTNDNNLKDYLKDAAKAFKGVIFKVSLTLDTDIATFYSPEHKTVEIVLSQKYVDSLLNQADVKEANLSLAVRLFHELGRPTIKSFYDMYKQEYKLIENDLLLYKILKKEDLLIEANYPINQTRILKALDDNPMIIGDFNKIIYAIELLEREAEKVFKNSPPLHQIGTTKQALDTEARDARIEEAYQIADPDFKDSNPAKRLTQNINLKGTFLNQYAQILGQRGVVQGRESFLFLAQDQVTRIPFNQFKDPRVPAGSRFQPILAGQKLEGMAENQRWGRQYYALHYGRRFSDGIGVTEAENGRDFQQKWHVHETTQEFTTSLSDDTRLRYGHKLVGQELTDVLDALKAVGKSLPSTEGAEETVELKNKKTGEIETRKVIGAKDDNKNSVAIIEDTSINGKLVPNGEGIKVPFGNMIAMPKGTFHTIKNASKTRPSIDFTVKDAVTQIIKTFSPPEEVEIPNPQIIAPATIGDPKTSPWTIYEHIYQSPYNSRLSINNSGEMEYYFDKKGDPIPKMNTPIFMKLRFITVKPGQETDLLKISPLYKEDGLEAIRFFPWPREIPPDSDSKKWHLDTSHKEITAQVIFYNEYDQEISTLARQSIEGGDMILINNAKKGNQAQDVDSYRVKNTSQEHDLVFFVVEPSDTIQRLLPFFDGKLKGLTDQIEGWKAATKFSTSQVLATAEKWENNKHADNEGERLIYQDLQNFRAKAQEKSANNSMPAGNEEKSAGSSDVADFEQLLNRVFVKKISENFYPLSAPSLLAGLKSAYSRYNTQDRDGLRKMVLDENSTIHVFVAWSDYANTRSSYRDDDAYNIEGWVTGLLENSIIPFSKLESFLKEFRSRHEFADNPDYSAQEDSKYGRVRARALAWHYLSKFDSFYVNFWETAQKKGVSFEDASKVFDSFWDGDKLIRSMEDINAALDRAQTVGGIDLNQINVNRSGRTINVQFDPAQLNGLMVGGFNGFMPVIIKMTPIQNPFQLLGVGPARREELLAKA